MTNITLRNTKGSPLTNTEVDDNFSNLNSYKVEQSDSTGSALIPNGATSQRDGSPSAGMFRYNSELNQFEGYTNDWEKFTTNLDSSTISAVISSDVDAAFINALTIDADTLGSQAGSYYLNYNNFTNTPYIPTIGTDFVDSSQARLLLSVTDAGGDGSFSYNNTNGVFTYTGPSASEVRAHFSAGTGISISSGTISSNDGQIVHDNLSGFVSDEHIAHSGVTLTAGNGLNGGGDITTNRTFNIDSAELYSKFSHDDFNNYVADEHVAHSSVTFTAGAGLTGGGAIDANRSFAVGEGTGITVSADAIATNDAEIVHDNLSGFVANEHIDHSSVTLTAGNGLTGGGTIAANRTFNIGEGTGITVSADAIATNDGEIVHDNLSGFVSDEHIAHSGVTLTAGNGLTGGGTIAASRTFAVGAGTGVTVNANDVAIGQDVATTADVTFNSITTTDGLIVGGNLQVTGTTTTVNSASLEVTDNMIYMNAGESDGSPTQSIDVGWAANVNDGGSYTHVGMFRDATDDRFKVFGAYTPEPDDAVEINTGHASFALADFQANRFHGNLTGNVTGNADTATALETARTIGLSGDVTATGVSFDGTGNITLTTAMAANSVDLTTHTTGNYVASGATSGNGISGSVSSEGGTFTVTSNATNANTGNTIVYRDASGNFSAGTISAAISGNASTATALASARTIGLTGDVTATGVAFDGSGNITLTTAMAANSVDLTTHTTGNYVATLSTGAGLDGSSSSEGGTPTISLNLNELSTSTTDGDGDFFVVLDAAGTQRKLTKGNINNSGFNNDAGYTTNVGDITGVTAGDGLTGGGASGSVTLNHADTSSQASVNNSGRTYIQDITLDTYGHITGITSATETVVNTDTTYSAGTALDLSGTTFNVDLSELSTSTTDGDGDYFVVTDTSNAQRKLTKGNINISGFNNDAGYTTNVGDITGVTAGTGLTGGGASGSVTLDVSGLTSSEFASTTSLIIYNSAGTALKTIRGPSS